MKVLIAGAGILGLSTAWRLATAGATVHLLDPRAPGHGATLAALGALWPASPLVNGPLQTLHRQSLQQFENFAGTVSRQAGVPVSYRRLGRIEILNSSKAVARAREESAAAPAARLDVVDFMTAQSLNPGLAPFLHGALHCRITAQVNVPELVTALVRVCSTAGVIFHESTAASGLLHSGGRISAVQTSAGNMEADAYLITAGAWTALLSPLLARHAPIVPAKGQGLAVAMPPSRPLTTIIKSGPIYLIPWDHEILIGSTTEPDAHFDEAPTDAARTKLLAGAAAILPELASAPVLRHWAGLRPCHSVKPHHPIMGPHPWLANLYLCAGHYKTGIGLAGLVSDLMCQAILQKKTPAALAPFLPCSASFTETPSPADS